MSTSRGPARDNPATDEVYGPRTYGRAFADVYDDWYHQVSDVESTVAFMAEVAHPAGSDAPILELGVGTGRLALPLARAGYEVHGVDASPEMLALLASRDPTSRVHSYLGDMGRTLPRGPFSVVFAAYNTFFNLVDEESQRSCLAMVSERLVEGGSLVIEAFTPDLGPGLTDDGGAVDDRGVEERPAPDGGLILNATIRDRVQQTITGQHIHLTAGGDVVLRPWKIRYLHPDQLDAMAAEFGLETEGRWGDWDRRRFDPGSPRHVSLYRKPR